MDRRSQLLKGVLDMCLLALIAEEPRYGYEIAQRLHDRGLGLIREGSIYPLLSRLQKQGLVDSYLESSSGGPQRKYYRIREQGREHLEAWRTEWRELSQGVDSVLDGGRR